MTPERLSFLEYEFTTSSLLAAFATRRKTHPIYAVTASEDQRDGVKKWVRIQLVALGRRYQSGDLTETQHIEAIRNLAAEASTNHGETLHQRRFRFGVAQKLVNLYLKYLWAAGIVKDVHHCPLDGIISNREKLAYEWTTGESEVEYLQAIFKLQSRVGEESLQSWETRTFQEARSAA